MVVARNLYLWVWIRAESLSVRKVGSCAFYTETDASPSCRFAVFVVEKTVWWFHVSVRAPNCLM